MSTRHLGAVSLALLWGCFGEAVEEAEEAPAPPSGEEVAVDWEALLEPAPRPEAASEEVAGAAELLEPQAESGRPAEDLGTRVEVRALPIPAIRQGATAAFELDDGGRGWVASVPGRQVLLTPAYGDGRVFVGGGFASTTMYALDAETGAVSWTMQAPDGGPSAAIVVDDQVLFNTESCTLFAVDAETGRTRWSRWLGDPLMSQPAAASGLVFSGHIWSESPSRYGFTAMDLRTGAVRWQRPMPHDVISAPVTADGSVFFSTMDGTVHRLDQRTGRQLWRSRLGAVTAPWVEGDRVLLARRVPPPAGARGPHEGQVALDAASGAVLWQGEPVPARHLSGAGRARRILASQAGAWGGSGDAAHGHLGVRNVAEGWAYQGPRPAVIDGRAYLVVGDRIECRRLEGWELLWTRRYAEDGGALSLQPPAVVGSQMVIATADGHVYGLDIDTGMAVWAYDVGEPVVYQPSVARGRVFVSTARGRVVAFDVGDETLDGWHMWGGDATHRGLAADPHAAAEPDPALAPDEPEDVAAEDGPGEGTLAVVHAEDHRVESLPLEHTSVEARVAGFVASVTVRQVFRNPSEEPLEAAYHFPLPTAAAVDSMILRAGETSLVGRIALRERARVVYRAARDAGLVAALLEQQRPNLFTQRVSNIPPGERVTVEIHYVQLLPYDDGGYELVFPMVAGARASDPTAEGDEDDLEQHVPGTRPPDGIELAVDLDAGVPIVDLDSPSHLLDIEQLDEGRARVSLAREDRIPNRDFVLRYRVGAEMPRAALLSHQDERGGFFTLVVQPGVEVPEALATRRRITFAVDTSSSMLGRPMAQARAVVSEALASLVPEDSFRIVTFSDLVRTFREEPADGGDEAVIAAEGFVDDLQAVGTTSLVAGLRESLAAEPTEGDVLDMVVLVTDGYVANEAEAMRLVHEGLGHRRLFAVGVGPAPNRFLLERLADLGRGALLVISPGDEPEVAAEELLARVARPQLTDLEVDWGELPVHSVYPRRLRDLFAGQPLLVRGRYDFAGEGRVTLRGRIGGRGWIEEVPVVLAERGPVDNEALASIWARAAVDDLMNGLYLREDPDRAEAVTDLGLTFGLVTRYTSFVAVDEVFLATMGGAGTLIGDNFGYGGLGLMGTGSGGGGYGSGSGYGTLGSIGSAGVVGRAVASAPSIRVGTASVRGSLSRDAIRRTIRLHEAGLRGIFERRLLADPSLGGRVEVQFVITPDGSVASARVVSSTVDDSVLEDAVVAFFRRLRFPSPEGGGTVIVTYPIVFVRSDDAAGPSVTFPATLR